MRKRRGFEERFWDKVQTEPNSGCWIWTGCITREGYGLFQADGKLKGSHRASYEFFVGPIPDGLQLDHKCRVRCCVNPDHLEPVTPKENTRRGVIVSVLKAMREARKTCHKGHPWDSDNTYLSSKNDRICKACAKERSLNRTEAQREKERARVRLWHQAKREKRQAA